VRRFEAVASHIPERAEILLPVDGETSPPPGRRRSADSHRAGNGGTNDEERPAMAKRGSKQGDRCCCCRAPSRPRSPRSFPMVRRGVSAGAA
jgi:hypothetical protein